MSHDKAAVSKAQADAHRRTLAALLREEPNRRCAECGARGPTWASVNLGVFVCLNCSGVHRSLGTHISKVRSATLDTWLPDQVAFVAATGNARAAAFWEARLPPGFARPAEGDMAALARFIGDKYREKKYAADGVPPTLENGAAAAPPAAPAAPAAPAPARPAPAPVADLLCLDDDAPTTVTAAAAAPAPGGGWASFNAPPAAAAAAAPAAAPDPHGWDAFVAASVAPPTAAPAPPQAAAAAAAPLPAMPPAPRAPAAPPATRADHAAILSLFDAAPAAPPGGGGSGGNARGGPVLPAPGGPGWP